MEQKTKQRWNNLFKLVGIEMTVGMLIGGFSTFLGLTDTMYDFFVALGSITIFLTYIISIANIVFKSLKGDTK